MVGDTSSGVSRVDITDEELCYLHYLVNKEDDEETTDLRQRLDKTLDFFTKHIRKDSIK